MLCICNRLTSAHACVLCLCVCVCLYNKQYNLCGENFAQLPWGGRCARCAQDVVVKCVHCSWNNTFVNVRCLNIIFSPTLRIQSIPLCVSCGEQSAVWWVRVFYIYISCGRTPSPSAHTHTQCLHRQFVYVRCEWRMKMKSFISSDAPLYTVEFFSFKNICMQTYSAITLPKPSYPPHRYFEPSFATSQTPDGGSNGVTVFVHRVYTIGCARSCMRRWMCCCLRVSYDYFRVWNMCT